MTEKFVNRLLELKELNHLSGKHGLIVIFGRRRVGKTRLLTHWLHTNNGLYSQAIESTKEVQLFQIYQDIRHRLNSLITPKSWPELWELIEDLKEDTIFCLDEFPYLVATDPSLPSTLQKLFDHRKKKNLTVILSGSSSRMMHDIFLTSSAPLYGRALKCIHLKPMDYSHFCESTKLKQSAIDSFAKFSMVGGIPKYWEFLDKNDDSISLAEKLYFDFSPYMENEPRRILGDEKVHGLNASSILEIIGRGAEKPSEIAARMNTPQGNLSRVLQQLIDASIIRRENPYGLSPRDTKRTLYKICDPAIRFWYRVYSPHRTTWHTFSHKEKQKLIYDHASTVFEDYIRESLPNSGRYWDNTVEFDLVYSPNSKSITIGEVKFFAVNKAAQNSLKEQLQTKFEDSKLSNQYKLKGIEIFDISYLNKLGK